MIWITSIIVTTLLLVGSFLRGCDRFIDPPVPPNPIIYITSFESANDTIGWKGWMEFRNEAPPQGGKRSVYISGGCIHPHAYYELPSSRKARYLMIRCWGKNLALGGGVELALKDETHNTIHISVTDTLWKFYQSSGKLFCPANSKLQLSMSAGGFIPSAMLVDLLEVIQVN